MSKILSVLCAALIAGSAMAADEKKDMKAPAPEAKKEAPAGMSGMSGMSGMAGMEAKAEPKAKKTKKAKAKKAEKTAEAATGMEAKK